MHRCECRQTCAYLKSNDSQRKAWKAREPRDREVHRDWHLGDDQKLKDVRCGTLVRFVRRAIDGGMPEDQTKRGDGHRNWEYCARYFRRKKVQGASQFTRTQKPNRRSGRKRVALRESMALASVSAGRQEAPEGTSLIVDLQWLRSRRSGRPRSPERCCPRTVGRRRRRPGSRR